MTQEYVEKVAREAYWEGVYDAMQVGDAYFLDAGEMFEESDTLKALRKGEMPDPGKKQARNLNKLAEVFGLFEDKDTGTQG